jgi:hypothetical protein
MITPSFSLTATEQVKPKLSLNFTSATLDPRVTFTRAGATATVTNSSGFIEAVAADTPRFDYNPITLACKGLLIEEARTNIALNSENFALWTPTNVTVTANATDAPTGTTIAQKIAASSTGSVSRDILFSLTPSVATYTYSIFVKPDETQFIMIRVAGGGLAAEARTGISVTNQTILRNTGAINAGVTVRFTPVANGFTRVELTVAFTSAISTSFRLTLQSSQTISVATAMTAGDGLYFYGAQIEIGAFASSYISVGATTVTRNADVATMTSTNFSDWYNQSKGTFRVDAISVASGNRPIISADDNTANESLIIKTQGNAPTFEITDGGSPQASVAAGTVSSNETAFAYVSYDVDFFGIARPTARQVDTSGTVPTVDRLRIGADQAGNYFSNTIQQIQFWP